MEDNDKTRNWTCKEVTISMPKQMLQKMDYLRHDVSRSKYIQRLFQEHMKLTGLD
jgi:metal-responsive CopG/Arc/MetJ family transcriptional regulator